MAGENRIKSRVRVLIGSEGELHTDDKGDW